MTIKRRGVEPCRCHRRRDALHVGAKAVIATAIVAGTLSANVAIAQTESGSAPQLDELRRQVQQLQRQLDQMQTQHDAMAARPAGPPAADAPSTQPPANGPQFQAGPLTLTFGGFAELASIYRNRNETADVSSNFNTGIPFPNSPSYHMSEFRESARQSRISLLTQGPQGGAASAEAFFETDFQSAAPTANSVESNSYNPRLRQAYGTYYHHDDNYYLLAGQTWSLATLQKVGITPRQEQIPLTIDGQFVPGFNWTRNPQLRFVKDLDNKMAVGVSLESPQANITAGPNPPVVPTTTSNPGGFLFAPTTNYSTDVAPDVIAKVAWDPGFGHYELYGLGRAFRDRASQENHTTFGGGIGGGMILPLTSQLDFQTSFLAGRGIGRYGSAQLPDVTVQPNGAFTTIPAFQALTGVIYRPTSAWTLYGYAGVEQAKSKAYAAVVDGTTLGYGYGSPLYNNSGCNSEGSPATQCVANTRTVAQATVGAWWKYYEGTLGNLQVGAQGSYTRRTTFDGIGGNPDVSMIVAMVSFRYYPYQR